MLYDEATHIINVQDDWTLGTISFGEFLSLLFQSLDLFFRLFDNPLERSQLTWRCAFVQQRLKNKVGTTWKNLKGNMLISM